MNQLNNHYATCESCGKRLKENKYVWDVIEDRIVCEKCYNSTKREIEKDVGNIMDAFIGFLNKRR